MNRPAMTWLVPLFWVIIGHAAHSQPLNAEQIYQKVLPSVGTIIVEKEDGSSSMGTAFLALRDGYAVTAWHVVQGAASASLRFSTKEEVEVIGLVDKDVKHDLALIRTRTAGMRLLPLSSRRVNVGTKAFAIGAPKGLEFSLSDGIVSQVQVVDNFEQIQFTCPVSSGNSGGPLINSNGEVIGVISWQVVEGQNLNFAIPSSYVQSLDSTLPTQPYSPFEGSARAVKRSAKQGGNLNKQIVDIAEMFDEYMSLFYRSSNLESEEEFLVHAKEIRLEVEELRQEVSDLTADDSIRSRIIEKLRSNTEYAVAFLDNAIRKDVASARYVGKKIQPLDTNDVKNYFFADSVQRYCTGSLVDRRADLFKLRVMAYRGKSLMLLDVAPMSLAEYFGFRADDVIQSANGSTFSTLDDFKTYVYNNRGKPVEISVLRRGTRQTLRTPIPGDLSQEKYFSRYNKWRSVEAWRRLKKDMRKDEVKEVLGDPARIEDDFWYYPNGGRLQFFSIFSPDKLYSWSEPSEFSGR